MPANKQHSVRMKAMNAETAGNSPIGLGRAISNYQTWSVLVWRRAAWEGEPTL